MSIVNKIPIAFQEVLGVNKSEEPEIPCPITPELLLKGYELITVGVIPANQPEQNWEPNPDPLCEIKNNYSKLEKIWKKLIEIYDEEFRTNLVNQAVNKESRYKPVLHSKLRVTSCW